MQNMTVEIIKNNEINSEKTRNGKLKLNILVAEYVISVTYLLHINYNYFR